MMNTTKQIPLDVIFDILANLPVKSLVRFKSISKRCSSIITDQGFAKIHSVRQSTIKPNSPLTPPAIIISCSTELQSAQMFFSSDLPEEGLGSGSTTMSVHLSTIPPRFSRYTTHSVNGIICMDFGLCATIFNPTTRQSTTLPFVCPPNSPDAVSTFFCVNFFGFDPIAHCYKVLNSWAVFGEATKYRVFTLGATTNNSWRLLSGGPSYRSKRESVWIDGVIYFKCHDSPVLFAFHLHTETFHEIQVLPGFIWRYDLIQFAGRVGLANTQFFAESDSIDIWLLEDHLEGIWICHSIVFPTTLWNEIEGHQNFSVVGTIHTGEILLAPRTLLERFCVYLHDVVKGRWRRIELSGLPEYRPLDFSSNAVYVTHYEPNILSLHEFLFLDKFVWI